MKEYLEMAVGFIGITILAALGFALWALYVLLLMSPFFFALWVVGKIFHAF